MQLFIRFYCSNFKNYNSRYRKYVSVPEVENLIIESKIYPKNTPSIVELEQKTKIMLINTDVAVDFPEPLPPNIIPVGGLQIVEPKPIPEVCI